MYHAFRLRTLALALATIPAMGQAAENVADKVAAKVVATVDGEEVTQSDLIAVSTEYNREKMAPAEFAKWQEYSLNKQLVMAIRTPLWKAYAKRAGLEPTAGEISAYTDKLVKGADEAAERSDSETEKTMEQRQGERRAGEPMASRVILEFKVGEALWREHGGACGFGTLGSCTPFKAQVAFLEGEVEAGRLVFHDPATEERFWTAMKDRQQLADVVVEKPAKIEEYFSMMQAMCGLKEQGQPTP